MTADVVLVIGVKVFQRSADASTLRAHLGDHLLEPTANLSTRCVHARTVRRVIQSEFFRREFSAEVDVCRSCGEHLWTPETRARFNDWIVTLKQERRDVFQIQVYLPDPVREGLSRFLNRFPGITPSVLMRVMVTVYLSAHIRYPEFKAILERLNHRPTHGMLAFGRRKKTSVQFSPMALLDIQSWSQVLSLAPHKILQDAVIKCLALEAETEPGLREFWRKSLRPQIEVILRAV